MAASLRAAGAALLFVAILAPAAASPVQPAEAAVAGLSPGHQEWLLEVDALIRNEERSAFLALPHDWQREAFIREFWRVRDPVPQTPRNELRDAWAERLGLARERFDDLDDDRARTLLLFGAPARVLEARCGGLLRPVEIWMVPPSDLVRARLTLAFVQLEGRRDGRYQLWDPRDGLRSLVQLMPSLEAEARGLEAHVAEECFRGDELLAALSGALGWQQLKEGGAVPAPPDLEWLQAFQARSTEVPEGAEQLPAELAVRFPGRHQSRTVVQGVITIPGGALGPPDSPRLGHSFHVDGAVLRRGELFESFRYRFEVPVGQQVPDEVPLVLQRTLRPGSYRLVLRVEELAGGRFFRAERELEVPLVGADGALAATAAAGLAVVAGEPAASHDLGEEVMVKLLPPPSEMLTGTVRLAAEVRGAVSRVRFELDGRPLMVRSSAPWELAVDLGRTPRVRRVRAVALDERGEEVADDEVALNAGPHRFTVRLLEPRPGVGNGVLRAWAVAELPPWEQLDRLELYLDETLLATLYQPPFVQPLAPPAGGSPSYVRAVGHLVGGGTAEDLVFLHAPENLDHVDVQLVELYTTVSDRRGRTRTDLDASDFRVLEDGREQQVLRFDWVENLPVHAGILLDTSSSMAQVMHQAERAALGFFEQLLTPRDRACVITFDDAPRLKVPFTSQVEVLAGGLADVSAQGMTALWDSIVYALYYFGGLQGKRVLVVLSDGEDTSSRYRFEEALEFARRSGVAIYAVGLNLPAGAVQARSGLERLARETGGRAFFIQRVTDLQRIYEQIGQELRSQYLLAYQSDATDTERYREVEVQVAEPGLSARTLKGYYP